MVTLILTLQKVSTWYAATITIIQPPLMRLEATQILADVPKHKFLILDRSNSSMSSHKSRDELRTNQR